VNGWLHAALCVVVPAAWSVVLHAVLTRIEARRRRLDRGDAPPIDYSI
jgi:hypothetical protein